MPWIEPIKKRKNSETIAAVRGLIKEGMSKKDIANKLGRSVGCIARIIKLPAEHI